MHLIRPFAGLRPAPAYAAAVAAPPYDVLSSDEARVRAAGKPWSFLHISKPEIDLPPGTDPHAPEVYAKAAENLQRMLQEGVLVRDSQPCYYAYRLGTGEHACADRRADFDAGDPVEGLLDLDAAREIDPVPLAAATVPRGTDADQPCVLAPEAQELTVATAVALRQLPERCPR